MTRHTLPLALAAMMAMGCQPTDLAQEEPSSPTEAIGKGTAVLKIRTEAFDIMPFGTRGTMALKDVSTRLGFALFYMNGEKVMNTKNQTSDETGYGNIDVRLSPDRYILVTVAHNGAGHCTISSPTEVKFANNKMTDTFAACDTFTVEEGEQTASIVLTRRVAMMRLVLDEAVPQEVSQLKFYYTGGSSTLDASTGKGSVNSRQTELLEVPAAAHDEEGSTYEIYTFPHEERDTIKLTITALTATGSSYAERELAKVPVRVGQITQFRGKIFGGDDTPGMQFELSVEDKDWTQANYTF